LEFVTRQEIWDDTIVIFSTDHGEMMFDHALITKGVKHYDSGIRCPLIVAGGGIRATVTDRLTCTLDFFPTILEWAKTNSRMMPPYEGRSFAAVGSGDEEENPWTEVTVQTGNVRSIITDDGFRFTIFDEKNQGQLYDLNSDPTEQRNNYYLDESSHLRTRLTERLVSAYMHPHQTPSYRNLPCDGDQRYRPLEGWRKTDYISSF